MNKIPFQLNGYEYNTTILRGKNNDFISKTCNKTRGIRQGCSIAALLFILTVEIHVLALNLASYKMFRGKKKGNNNEIKLIQHASDSTNPFRDMESVTCKDEWSYNNW